MISQIKKSTHDYWMSWVKKRNTSGNPQIVDSRNVYILPSGFGWIYGFLLLSLFSGAINYQMSTVFLMTFILAIIGLVSAWEAHANLKDLTIKLISIKDTEQGKPVQLGLLIQSNHKIRFGIEFRVNKQSVARLEKIPPEGLQFILPIETVSRGYYPLPRIEISSLFPFGIFLVWGYIWFDKYYYVYPQPIDPGFWPQSASASNQKKKSTPGDDEIYDLKQVENPWTQPNLIAWKIAAKGLGWYLKTRDSTEGDYWMFQLSDLPSTNVELQLQYLSYWLHTAEGNHQIYGLKLGKYSIQPGQGEAHLQECLRQLALV